MSLVVSCGFLDVFELQASLRPRMHRFEGIDGVAVLPIRWEQDDGWHMPAKWREKWPELGNAVSRIEERGTALGYSGLGSISLEMLMPQCGTPWARAENDSYIRLHVPLRTNPAAFVYVAGEAHHLLPGIVAAVETRLLHSAANLGEAPRIHLIVELRRKEPSDDAREL